MKEVTKLWLGKARNDLLTVQLIMEHDQGLFDTVCFHCHMYVEKSLKAYLLEHGHDLVKTHDLIRLLDLCQQYDNSFHDLKSNCACLNELFVDSRYPGEDLHIADAQKAFAAAKYVENFLLGKLI
jgi:HEPN domain-containing protein